MSRLFTRKKLIWFSAILLSVIGLVMAAWVAVAGPVTVARVIRYGDKQ